MTRTDKNMRDIVIDSLRPMSDLVDLGVIYTLNEQYFMPRGFIIGIYIDDDDGQTALGWACLDLETAEKIGLIPSQEDIDNRKKALDHFKC